MTPLLWFLLGALTGIGVSILIVRWVLSGQIKPFNW